MDIMGWVIIGVITVLGLGAAVAVHFYKKRNIGKLFIQVHESSKQIPKQKRNSFVLLMFTEAMSTSSKKSKMANMNKLSNPKYMEVQLMKMSKILKDTSAPTDKKTKNALKLLKDYLKWEEEKKNKAAQIKKENKAS